LELPKPHWVELENIDEMDIFLETQLSPSPLARERASVAIAELLKNDKHVYDRLLNDIKNQKLESVIALRFLPLIKALESEDIAHIDVNEVYQTLPFTSVLLEKLIETLAFSKNDIFVLLNFSPKNRTLSTYPTGFQIRDSFDLDTQYFNVPLCKQSLEKLKRIQNFLR
jgi:hypothetical protein